MCTSDVIEGVARGIHVVFFCICDGLVVDCVVDFCLQA